MKRASLLLVLLSAIAAIAPARAQSSGRQRLAVDTVAAMNAISGKIDNLNAEPQQKIDSIQKKICSIEDSLASNRQRLEYLSVIHSHLSASAPKIKEPQVRDKITEFLTSSFSAMPEDSVLSYCKPKDVRKARSSDNPQAELQKIKDKTAEKILNSAKKGNFSSGYALGCVSFFLKEADHKKDALNSELTQAQAELKAESAKLVAKPQSFSAATWFDMMGDTDVPTKTITDAKGGCEGVSFEQLVEKHYSSTPYPTDGDLMLMYQDRTSQRDDFEKNGSAKGKFDGLIKDRIGAFPANITMQNYWEYPGGVRENGKFSVFDRVSVVSENGTVPAFEYPLGFKTFLSEWSIPFQVETVTSYWDESGRKRDGISIFCNYPESSWGKMTLMYNDGNVWRITTPDDAKFLTYEESLDRIRENGYTPQTLVLKEKYDDYTGDIREVQHTFLVVTNKLIGHSNDTDDAIFLKYYNQNNAPTVAGGYCKIEVPEFSKIYVDKFAGMEYSGDVIVAEGSIDTANGTLKKKYFYRPGSWEIEEELDINGTTFIFSKDVILIAEGTYNDRANRWEIKEMPQGDL